MMKQFVCLCVLIFSANLVTGTFGCRTVCGDLSDKLEPNDTALEATPLTYGESVDAGSHYGNVDFFKITVESATTLGIRVDSRDSRASRAILEVRGPTNDLLYTDVCPTGQAGCAPDLLGKKINLKDASGLLVGYELEVPAAEPGDYIVQVQATGSDHMCEFSWEYTIEVNQEN